MSETLADVLPKEMARIRDVVIPAYQECGPGAQVAIAFMRRDLDRAAKAMMEGDLAEMIAVYSELKDYRL